MRIKVMAVQGKLVDVNIQLAPKYREPTKRMCMYMLNLKELKQLHTSFQSHVVQWHLTAKPLPQQTTPQ